ncbi:MAG TPA: hypothetical protein VFZ52_17610 [Chryseolinea sp.]
MCFLSAKAQTKKKVQSIFRDSLDGAFDFSNFLIDVHGFVPVPFLITEPALGGFGVGLGFMFIHKEAPMIDTVGSEVKILPTPPDITGLAAGYTANNTWLIGAVRSGIWRKIRTKYRVVGGYANVNLSFFRTIAGAEREFELNFKTVPLSGYLMRQFKGTVWSAGIQYLYLKSKLRAGSGDLPEFITDKETNSLVSMPGVIVEYDSRDNIFTPDRGIKFHASFGWSDDAFGSDYDYTNVNVYAYAYHSLSKKITGGIRYEMQQVFEDPPFYLLPFIDMRGIPVARYQGNIFSVLEGEVRWDFVPRWSVVAFGGTGKAYDTWSDFNDSDYESSGGLGVRYLMARRFKLRMGVDVARGPEQWAYYIVLGSAWKNK